MIFLSQQFQKRYLSPPSANERSFLFAKYYLHLV